MESEAGSPIIALLSSAAENVRQARTWPAAVPYAEFLEQTIASINALIAKINTEETK